MKLYILNKYAGVLLLILCTSMVNISAKEQEPAKEPEVETSLFAKFKFPFIPFYIDFDLSPVSKELTTHITYDKKISLSGDYKIELYKPTKPDKNDDYTLLIVKRGTDEKRFKINKGNFFEFEGYPANVISKVSVKHKIVTIEILTEFESGTLKIRNNAVYPTIDLNVRTTPNFTNDNDNIMGVIPMGEAVQYLGLRSTNKSKYMGKSDYWYFIRMEDGRRGWVLGCCIAFHSDYDT